MSKIEWTDETSNPLHLFREDGGHGGHHCIKISPGCANCYAEKLNNSGYFSFASNRPYTGEIAPNFTLDYEMVRSWSRMKKPRKIFLCSMTDLFGDWVRQHWQFAILDGALNAPKQTFQILTKRPELMRQRILSWLHHRGLNEVPANIWIGASIESRKYLYRADILAQIPAQNRFVSAEPLLEDLGEFSFQGINWVIVGGESGRHARNCNAVWIQRIVARCHRSGIKIFVKQLGRNPFCESIPLKIKDRKGGDISEFPVNLQIREFP